MKKTITIKNVKFIKPKSTKYDKKSLAEGMKVEREHTKNKKVAKVIAENHLDEKKDYYKKLRKVEKKK